MRLGLSSSCGEDAEYDGVERVPFRQGVLDVALHDATGKLADLPVHAPLGGRVHREIPLTSAIGIEILASGLTDCGVSFAAVLHLFSGYDLALPAELNGPELLADLYVDGLANTAGTARVPEGPGLRTPDIEGRAIRREVVWPGDLWRGVRACPPVL